MAFLIIALITLSILIFFLVRRKNVPAIVFRGGTRWLLWTGLLVLGLYAIFWFALGVVEMSSSLTASIYHIIPGLIALVMVWIIRKIPLESGLALTFQGLAVAVYTLSAVSGSINNRLASSLFSAAPLILAGLCILWACGLALARKK